MKNQEMVQANHFLYVLTLTESPTLVRQPFSFLEIDFPQSVYLGILVVVILVLLVLVVEFLY